MFFNEWAISVASPFTEGRVVVNAVPFIHHVQEDCAARNDKTWQRFKGWTWEFYRHLATRVEEITESGDNALGTIGAAEAVRGGADPTVIMRARVERGESIIVRRYFIAEAMIAMELRWHGWEYVVAAPFEVVRGDDVIVSAHYSDSARGQWETDPVKDWDPIAELSGQKAARQVRMSIAAGFGQMAGLMVGRAMHPLICRSAAIALTREDFRAAKRGGYIVIGMGKYILTREDAPGYYQITRETDRVRFARLVEPYGVAHT